VPVRRRPADPTRKNIVRRQRPNALESDAAGPVKTKIGENFVDPGGGIRIDVAIQLEPTRHFRSLRDKQRAALLG
jgi:hypothetical protein